MTATALLAAEYAGVDVWLLAAAVLIVFVGSATQSAIGVGLGLMAAPTLSLMDDVFIPGAIILVNLPLTIGIATREWDRIDWSIMRAVPVRAIGTLIGTWLVVEGGQRAVAIVIASAVLLAVASSLTGLKVRPTRRNQLIAGGVAGVSGTVAGIGGPPMAITYQYEDAGVLRASLAAFNAVSIMALSIPLLAIAGVIGWREVQLAVVLVAGVFAGLWVGKHAIGRLHPERVRYLVLFVCAASAIIVLAKQLF
jgi:uncharacterized membrane protein YfcA